MITLTPFLDRRTVNDSLMPPERIAPRVAPPQNVAPFAAARVRFAGLDDLSDLAALLTRSFHPQDSWLGWLAPVFQLGLYQDLRGRLLAKAANTACLVAVHPHTAQPNLAPELVGTVEVAVKSSLPWQPFLFRYPYISNLAVERQYRRQGIGRQLLLACEPPVREWGYKNLYLHVLETNQPAQQLYAQVGYQVAKVESNWVGSLVGSPRRLLLCKHLE